MLDYELLDPRVLVSRGDRVDALAGELNLIVSVSDDCEHCFINSSDDSCLCFAILASEEANPELHFCLLEVVKRPDQIRQEFDSFDALEVDEHILVFEHVDDGVEDDCVVTILDRH